MFDDLEEKIVNLEMRISFQDDTLDQLNEVILFQNTKIEAMQKQLDMLGSKVQAEESGSTVYDQKPPHY